MIGSAYTPDGGTSSLFYAFFFVVSKINVFMSYYEAKPAFFLNM